jgi:hypothetical protein
MPLPYRPEMHRAGNISEKPGMASQDASQSAKETDRKIDGWKKLEVNPTSHTPAPKSTVVAAPFRA